MQMAHIHFLRLHCEALIEERRARDIRERAYLSALAWSDHQLMAYDARIVGIELRFEARVSQH
jgi:hypothetical protein